MRWRSRPRKFATTTRRHSPSGVYPEQIETRRNNSPPREVHTAHTLTRVVHYTRVLFASVVCVVLRHYTLPLPITNYLYTVVEGRGLKKKNQKTKRAFRRDDDGSLSSHRGKRITRDEVWRARRVPYLAHRCLVADKNIIHMQIIYAICVEKRHRILFLVCRIFCTLFRKNWITRQLFSYCWFLP